MKAGGAMVLVVVGDVGFGLNAGFADEAHSNTHFKLDSRLKATPHLAVEIPLPYLFLILKFTEVCILSYLILQQTSK